MNGFESIMDKEKKRMCELENKITKIPQYKQQRKKYTQKNEQSLQACEIMTKDLIFVSLL